MDRITGALLESFCESNDLKTKDISKQFEYFVNYCIISKYYRGYFSLEEVDTGEGNDAAIDGIAMIVNGKIINNEDELSDIINECSYLDCDLYVIQSKTSSSFEGRSMLSFISGVKDFVSENPQLIKNEHLKSFNSIWSKIIKNSALMSNRLPRCHLFYVTTGKWVGDNDLEHTISIGSKEIEATDLFDSVKFKALGANEIQALYRETQNKLETTISFQNKITLPDIPNVKESYLGILSLRDFIHLIEDEEQNLHSIFYDNIRDFLGDNPVNKKIEKTIKDNKLELFSILNNGVTIVASDLIAAGNRFTLKDYQIVNGCQTSHVLHKFRDIQNSENLTVPIKIIATRNDDLKNEITIATNSQTEVKPEQLASLTEFQKKLELYYSSIKGENRLYYERRTQQYHSDTSIKKIKIISIPIQIKSFASVFLEVPHAVSGYYGTIVKRFKDDIFNENHKYSPYYASALCYYKLERLFGNGSIDKEYKKLRFHILMLVRMISTGIKNPPLNSNQLDRACNRLIDHLDDNYICHQIFKNAIDIIDVSSLDLNQKQFKSDSETKELIEILKNRDLTVDKIMSLDEEVLKSFL